MLDASVGTVYFMRLGLGEPQGRILGACRINGFEAVALIDVHGFNHGRPSAKRNCRPPLKASAQLAICSQGLKLNDELQSAVAPDAIGKGIRASFIGWASLLITFTRIRGYRAANK